MKENIGIVAACCIFVGTLSAQQGEMNLIVQPIEQDTIAVSTVVIQDWIQPVVEDTIKPMRHENEIEEVIITANNNRKSYKRDSSAIVAKLPLKDLENSQVYNTIPSILIEEQVVTSFNEAIKNATGVTRLWESTGRGGDGSEWYTMRGFSVQPTMVNGLAMSSNTGSDPASIEQIEVLKGPSGTLFGSSLISYGGLININTKQAHDRLAGSLQYIAGSYGLNRLEGDINVPIGEQTNFRLVSAYQNQNSFQDAGFKESFYINPILHVKASDRLDFHFTAEILRTESANAPMIFLNRSAPLSFDNLDLFKKNYDRSFTSNELTMKNPTASFQAEGLYRISDHWKSQTLISRGQTKTDGYYQYLWDLADGDSFTRYISYRNGYTNTTDVQQNFIGNFTWVKMKHQMVLGIDFLQRDISNGGTLWASNGIVKLSDGSDSGDLTAAGVDDLLGDTYEGNTTAKSQNMSAYFFDVINLIPSLSVQLGARVDNFKGQANYWEVSELESQTTFSPKLGLVYQPIQDHIAVFANYMNGFVPISPAEVSEVDGSNPRLKLFDPEHANQWEIGTKLDLLSDNLSATLSYYDIKVENIVITDPDNPNNSIQGGAVNSKGFELSLVASPLRGLNLIAGYSDNKSKVTKDNESSGYLGLRPEEAGPEETFNYWVSYRFQQEALQGLGVGIGGNYASEQKTINRTGVGTFILPAYNVMNASVSYNLNNFGLILKINNMANKQYYTGWSTVSPQMIRNYALSMNYKF